MRLAPGAGTAVGARAEVRQTDQLGRCPCGLAREKGGMIFSRSGRLGASRLEGSHVPEEDSPVILT